MSPTPIRPPEPASEAAEAPAVPPRGEATLTRRVVGSLGWILTNIAAKNGIQFLRMWVLWKLLSREDFGLNSMAWIAISGVMLLQDMGFTSALIQRKADLDAAVSVAWYANLLIRIVMYAVLFLLAPHFAADLKESELTAVLRWTSFSIVMGAFGVVNEALLRKSFGFRKILIVDTVEALVLTGVQIASAAMGHGVWSLVHGTLAAALARSLVLWRLQPIRVGRFDPRVAWEMFHFGKHMTLSTLGLWLIKNMDYYFVGRFLGKGALGVYTLAFKLSDLIAVNIVRQFGSVLFPAFTEIGADHARLRGAWGRAVRYSLALVMPLGIALIVFAPEIIAVFFPKGGAEAALPVSILTAFALFRAVGSPLGDLAKGIGKPHILTQVVVFHVAIMAPLLWAAAALLRDDPQTALVAVSCVVSGSALAALTLTFVLVSRVVRFRLVEILGVLAPAAAAGAGMAAAGWGLKALADRLHGAWALPPLAILIAGCAISGLVYCAILWLTFPRILDGIRETVRRRRARA